MEVKINKEIRNDTESMFFGLLMRQFIFFVLACGVAVALYFLLRPYFGTETLNDLHIDGLPRVDKLNALVGKYVNLEYTLPNGQKVKFLDDQKTYLGNQLESEFGGDRCFGILASMDFILVCTYEKDGENPELLIYKKR